jgi:hypothetical protein
MMLLEKLERCFCSLSSNVGFDNRFGERLGEDGFYDFAGCSNLAKKSSGVQGICIFRYSNFT